MNDNRPPPTKDEWTSHDTRVAIFFALLFFVIGPAVLIGLLSLCMPMRIDSRSPGIRQRNQRENQRVTDSPATPQPATNSLPKNSEKN